MFFSFVDKKFKRVGCGNAIQKYRVEGGRIGSFLMSQLSVSRLSGAHTTVSSTSLKSYAPPSSGIAKAAFVALSAIGILSKRAAEGRYYLTLTSHQKAEFRKLIDQSISQHTVQQTLYEANLSMIKTYLAPLLPDEEVNKDPQVVLLERFISKKGEPLDSNDASKVAGALYKLKDTQKQLVDSVVEQLKSLPDTDSLKGELGNYLQAYGYVDLYREIYLSHL